MVFVSTWRRLLLVLALLSLSTSAALAADLKPKTSAAFDRYVAATEARINREIQAGGPYLYIDAMTPQARNAAYARLRRGEILMDHLTTQMPGKFGVPDGMIHHWVGLIFIPGATLRTALPVLQNYDRRVEFFKPDVIACRVLAHQDGDYKLFVRINQKQFTTVVYNTEYDVHWEQLDPTHVYSRSVSTRIAEVKDANRPDGPEFPVDRGRGYLWRINTYFRFQEKDGGLYIQSEVVSLSRDLPFGLGWLLRPILTSVPKHGLTRMLGQTRTVLQQQLKINTAQFKPEL